LFNRNTILLTKIGKFCTTTVSLTPYLEILLEQRLHLKNNYKTKFTYYPINVTENKSMEIPFELKENNVSISLYIQKYFEEKEEKEEKEIQEIIKQASDKIIKEEIIDKEKHS